MTLQQRIALGSIVIAHAVLAFLQNWLFRQPDYGGVVGFGIGIAQINLIAVWGAMSAGPVVRRLPWAVLLTTGMWYAIVLSNRLVGHSWQRMQRHDALLLGFVLGGAVLVAMIPLWIARRWQAWRLTLEGGSVEDNNRFNIREVLIGTTLMCVALALVQAVLPAGDTELTIDNELQLLLPLAVVANFITALPTVWLSFARPGLTTSLLLFAVPIYSGLVAIPEMIVIHIGMGEQHPDLWSYLWILNCTQFWVLGGTLVLLRCQGFHLVRVDRPDKHPGGARHWR